MTSAYLRIFDTPEAVYSFSEEAERLLTELPLLPVRYNRHVPLIGGFTSSVEVNNLLWSIAPQRLSVCKECEDKSPQLLNTIKKFSAAGPSMSLRTVARKALTVSEGIVMCFPNTSGDPEHAHGVRRGPAAGSRCHRAAGASFFDDDRVVSLNVVEEAMNRYQGTIAVELGIRLGQQTLDWLFSDADDVSSLECGQS